VVLDSDYPDPGIVTSGLNEAYLDVEWSGAIAPNAQVVYVYSTDFRYAIQYAVDNNLAPVITSSGTNTCEQNTTLNTGFYRLLAQQANAQGITWLNDSGDSGAAGCDAKGAAIATGGLGVHFPSSIPEVTSVGGLQFNPQGVPYWAPANTPNQETAVSYIPEAVWNGVANTDAVWAGSGGASVLYTKPAWQSGPGVPNDNARDVPDVSFESAAVYYVYAYGAPYAVGGTSASTPSFAGVVVLLNQYLKAHDSQPPAGLGNINPALYRMFRANPSGIFHDITVGNNIVPCEIGTKDCSNGQLGYSAGPGYDLASGLGSIDVAQLFLHWSDQPPQLAAGAAVNGASFAAGAAMAPGSIFSIFGVNLASATESASAIPLNTALADAQVSVAGRNAPLFYVGAGQINAQLPFETPVGNQPLLVTTSGVQSNTIVIPVAASAPGIFLYNGNYAVAQHANSVVVGPSAPAVIGETVVVYGTGQGASLTAPIATGAAAPLSPTSQVAPSVLVTATIGGINAPVSYAGLTSGFVGLLQVNLQIPAGLAAGDYPLVLTIGSASSASALVSVVP
jgi:uncharacterized protein (TIGR03437 family)